MAQSGKQITIRLSEDQVATLHALTPRYGGRIKATIVAGLSTLAGQTDINLPDALERAAALIRQMTPLEPRTFNPAPTATTAPPSAIYPPAADPTSLNDAARQAAALRFAKPTQQQVK